MTTIKGSTNSDTTGTKSCTCICDKQLYQCPNNNSCPIVAYPEPTESKPDGWFHCVECENPKEDCTCVELPLKADARPVKEVTAPLSDKVGEAVNELANEDAQWREENPVTPPVSKEVKTAEEILSEYNSNNSAYVHVDDAIGAINDFHSQFATEAVGKKNDKGFYGYVVTERLKAAELLSEGWLDKEPKHRVAIENLLIAYDQMMDKLEPEATKPNNLVDVEEVIKKLDLISENILSYKITEDVDANDHMYNQGINRGIFEINKIRQSLSK